jgi:hypothetical protein
VTQRAAENEQKWQALPEELKDIRRLSEANFGTGSPVPNTLTPREKESEEATLAKRARELRERPGQDRGDRGR